MTVEAKQLVYQATGTILVGACAYEGAALTTGRLPTMTSLCRRYRLVEVAVMAVLVTHLHLIKEIADEASGNLDTGPWPGNVLLRYQGPQPLARAFRLASRPAKGSRRADRRG